MAAFSQEKVGRVSLLQKEVSSCETLFPLFTLWSPQAVAAYQFMKTSLSNTGQG
jgi:hypothetical protein